MPLPHQHLPPDPLLESRIPTGDDPTSQGPDYHHRLSTREAETAIFIQYAPEIEELKEVLSSGMVKFKRTGASHGGQVVVQQKATREQMSEASDALKLLITERDRLICELWDKFVARWGGRVERRDDATMFVVDEGRHLLDRQQGGGGGGEQHEHANNDKMKMQEQVQDDDADPYVKRMRQVQARMDDLAVAEERKKAKRASAGKRADEYAQGAGASS
ncbi:hypothetical protein GJ744_009131 [Endocarpon pusillum]|uniref:Uncharacterized protein n=1 Tax=Endocarpon pusillum TaxID=364733 RepID=A0A8H7AKE2_9EURO|nr:hypothetical protein GJ744_009131 [Endocarpon pusillum]